jgi:hypothetical protein
VTGEQWARFDSWPKGVTVDPHPRKSWFIIWWVVTPHDQIIILDEWPQTDYYHTDIQLGIEGAIDLFARVEGGDNRINHPLENMVYRFMDPNSGRQRVSTSGQSLQEHMADHGLWFDTDVIDDVAQGHIVVSTRLNEDGLLILPHCHNTIEAMERYVYREYRNHTPMNPNEKPREEYKDGADVVRYTCMKRPWFYLPQQRPLMPQEMRNMGLG